MVHAAGISFKEVHYPHIRCNRGQGKIIGMKQARKINVKSNYRLLSMEQTDVSPMDLLGQRLRAKFPEIISGSVCGGNQYFQINIAEGTEAAPFMKAFDSFVKEYLTPYADRETEYDFNISRGRELINIITYNSDDRGNLVDVKLNGKLQSLFVVDVLGATGDFTVFNDDFETVGFIHMRDLNPPRTELDYGDNRPFPNFGDSSLWEASNTELSLVLKDIVEQIADQIDNGNYIYDQDFEDID